MISEKIIREIEIWDQSIGTAEEKIPFNEDALVISCVLYRLRRELSGKYNSYLLSSHHEELAIDVIDEDRDLARSIKADFRKKLAYFALTIGKLSKFKYSLHEYLETDFFDHATRKFLVPKKYMGMLFKLPYFYEYDEQQRELFVNAKLSLTVEKFVSETQRLHFLKKMQPSREKVKGTVEYWFKTDDDVRVMLSVSLSNPLIGLLDKHLSCSSLCVSGVFNRRTNYSVQYYVADKWNINV